ncbi:MAG: bifunctional acetate--CoA ligase family protein/GNAT family N-acetyltransferase [Burkholderiales bacterium]|nr:bifunctional acetate--CoA ligase family protein/GNAT family N-acetyltransferase [Burkholderiales bacterium]
MRASSLDRHYLTPLLEPSSVAIVGASPRAGSVGAVLIENMRAAGFRGALFPVNPKHGKVADLPCFASLRDVPQRVDLAVIATPAQTVPGILEDCGEAGVRAVCVISAGFGEVGPAGAKLERAALDACHRYRIRMLGPNCLGLMRPRIGLNATFAHGGVGAGALGLISQSGAVCTAVLDWAAPHGIGFSSVVSLGGSADVDFGELVDYLVNDPSTEHILLYIEGVRDARRFMSALRAAARVKPVILMKVGRHPAGSRAAVSHTGALTGADDVFEAAVRRAGVVRVKTIGQLVAAAHALSSKVHPRGDRLAVITNGGGPGVMAADRAADLGIPLAELSPASIEALKRALPANWSHGNPIDLIGDADAARYDAALGACLADPGIDGVLAILTPQALTPALEVARAVVARAAKSHKPLLTCWMGEAQVGESRALFARHGVPTFRTPDPAIDMFAHVSAFYRNQRILLQTPGPLAYEARPDVDNARLVIEAALAEHRTVLSETESKAVLAAFHVPIARAVVTRSANEAMVVAQELGYPVAMKIDSPDITHKSDVGGVKLNVGNAQAVRDSWQAIRDGVARLRPEARINGVIVEPMVSRANARELMIGVVRDPVFGPAITFGLGGTAVEVLADRAVALPPLNGMLVDELVRGTRAAKLLGKFRSMPPADRAALEAVLLRVSEMSCELPQIREMDVNPLLVDETGAIVVDARIVVEPLGPAIPRYSHMAIHPYPSQLVGEWIAADGARVEVRPIRPEDAEIEQAFVRKLSPESRYFRFMDTIRELTPQMLVRFTQIDYDREMAFIAVTGEDGAQTEVGVARYVTNPDGSSCEFAIVVADEWQKRGLGRRLMMQLIEVARARGLARMIGHILATNRGMLSLSASLGFALSESPDDPTVRRATLTL